MADPERKLAAILSADVVGYSRLMAEGTSGPLAERLVLRLYRSYRDLRRVAVPAWSRGAAARPALKFRPHRSRRLAAPDCDGARGTLRSAPRLARGLRLDRLPWRERRSACPH